MRWTSTSATRQPRRLGRGLPAALIVAMCAVGVMSGCTDDPGEGNNGLRDISADVDPGGPSQLDAGDVDPGDTSQPQDVGGPDGHTSAADTGDVAVDLDGQTSGSDTSEAADTGETVDIGGSADIGEVADTDESSDITEDTTDPPTGCEGLAAAGSTYELASGGPNGQLYASAAFDGEGIWVSYARPETDGTSQEDIYAVRIMCDGTIGAGPMQVNTTAPGTDSREYDPRIDVRGKTVYVVWTAAEAGSGAASIAYRTFGVGGTPKMAEAADITPQDAQGAAVSELIWDPDVAGLPGGGAVVVASYATSQTFQVVAQQVDDVGNRVGSYGDVYANTQVEQAKPMVEPTAAGRAWVSWTSSSPATGASPETVYRQIDLDNPQQVAPTTVGAPPQTYDTLTTPVPAPMAVGDTADQPMFLAHTTDEYDVHVMATNTPTPDDTTVDGGGAQYSLRPDIASGPGGGVVAWYAGTSPSAFSVKVQPFRYDTTSGLRTDPVIDIPLDDTGDAARAPYGPTVVYVGGGLYFVGWSEGPAANQSRVFGRFIEP